jgi:tetratricopeptide (TPR) repeat protein
MRYMLIVLLFMWSGFAVATDADDLVKKGQDALVRMDVPGAMTYFDAALQLDPTQPMAAYGRGRIFLKMGETKKAMADFTTAIIADPKFGLAYVRRGEAMMVLKNPDGAFKDFEAAIAASPKDAEVYVVRATYRFQIGNLAGAKADVEAALLVADDTQKPVLEKMLARMK